MARSSVAGLVVASWLVLAGDDARAATLPAGFTEEVALRGLTQPTTVRFARDGRVFVAEKSGIIKVFDNLSDTSAEVFADLSRQVHGYWDRGLLGLALHPTFPDVPSVWVLYTYDAPPGQTAPVWNDKCADPTGKGCVVTARLARLTAEGNRATGETVLIDGSFCAQFPSHSIGDLAFGPDGALYLSAGDGASFTKTDTGQHGSPPNPCGDPAGEGGALRSQDVLSPDDEPSHDGVVLRLDPMTGRPMSDNPLAGGSTPHDDAVIAFGLRNPVRMSFRPGTRELWLGDVGAGRHEELNRIANVGDGVIENFGWPCFEGPRRNVSYEKTPLCQQVYAATARVGQLTGAHFAYEHGKAPDPAACGTGTQSAITGVAFYAGGSYPSAYDGAAIFADYARGCIWAMLPGAQGDPDPAKIITLVAGANKPVGLTIGPDGDLFYVDHAGTVRRIRHASRNRPPVAALSADVTSGRAPLTVKFDAGASRDPDAGDSLTFAWDLDDDGAFDDGAGPTVERTFDRPGGYQVGVRVTDRDGAGATAQVTVQVDNAPPVASIVTPAAAATFAVRDVVTFEGRGDDPDEGVLPAARMRWSLVLLHCAADGECHDHELETIDGVASGTFAWPDHDLPYRIALQLEVTDRGGLKHTARRELQPRTVELTLATEPPGLMLQVGTEGPRLPSLRRVPVGADLSLEALSPQTLGGVEYLFVAWSHGAERTHDLVAPASAATFTARYQARPMPMNPPDAGPAPAPPGPDAGAAPAPPGPDAGAAPATPGPDAGSTPVVPGPDAGAAPMTAGPDARPDAITSAAGDAGAPDATASSPRLDASLPTSGDVGASTPESGLVKRDGGTVPATPLPLKGPARADKGGCSMAASGHPSLAWMAMIWAVVLGARCLKSYSWPKKSGRRSASSQI